MLTVKELREFFINEGVDPSARLYFRSSDESIELVSIKSVSVDEDGDIMLNTFNIKENG